MALVTETKRKCDVYPGARDVRRTRVTVELLKNWETGEVDSTELVVIKDLSKRARKRLLQFLDRGSSAIKETESAEDDG